MSEELLPCCKQKPYFMKVVGSNAYIIKCGVCKKQVNSIGYQRTKTLWNTRKEVKSNDIKSRTSN